MSPALSVIMPVYNGEKYLAQAVQSVLNQSFADLELILVDDGSTDASVKICKQFAVNDTRVVVCHLEHSGQSVARNRALEIARGDYVAFADCDDLVASGAYARMMERIQGKELDFIRFRLSRFSQTKDQNKWCDEPECLCEKHSTIIKEIAFPMIGATHAYPYMLCGTVCTSIYRRSIICAHNVRFPDARRVQMEDLLFNLRFLAFAEKGESVNEVSYYYRTNLTSYTNRYDALEFARVVAAYHEIFEQAIVMEVPVKECTLATGSRLIDSVSVCWKKAAQNFNFREFKMQMVTMTSACAPVWTVLCNHCYVTRGTALRVACFMVRHRWYWLLYYSIRIMLGHKI